MHPDHHCNWYCLDMGGKERVLEVGKGEDEEDCEKVKRGVGCMLQVVGVPNVSLVRSVDVRLGRVLHSCQGEDIGKATDEEEPNAGQKKPGFVVEDHLSHNKGGLLVSVSAMFEMCSCTELTHYKCSPLSQKGG